MTITPDTAHPLTALAYSALGPAMCDGDADAGYPLLALIDACLLGAQPVWDVVTDNGHTPGWAAMFDPQACPESALPWLAQFPGVPLDQALSTQANRDRIAAHIGWYRGTAAVIKRIGTELLPAGARVDVFERDGGDPQKVRVRVFSETVTEDQQAVLEAAMAAALPAGDTLVFEVATGGTYAEVRAGHPDDPSYTGREAKFPTYHDASTYVPPPV